MGARHGGTRGAGDAVVSHIQRASSRADATLVLSEAALDRLNERLMTAIHADGRVYCSNAVIDGRFGLRACIVNFHTAAADIDAIPEIVVRLGRETDAELGGAP